VYDKIQVVNPNEKFSIFSPLPRKMGRLIKGQVELSGVEEEFRLCDLASLREHPDFHAKTPSRKELHSVGYRFVK